MDRQFSLAIPQILWRFAAFAPLIFLTLWSLPASAQQAKPLWEVQGFGFGEWAPDYPGSNQHHLHALGGPWLVYRGSFLRTDQVGGVSGVLVDLPRLEFDISAAGSFPVSSSNDTARQGMPSLDWLGEIGPRARLNLFYWSNFATGGLRRLSLELPVRAAGSTNLSSRADYRGWTVAPALTYRANDLLDGKTGLELSIGPQFVNAGLGQYFYSVAPAYATPTRAAYSATGGYLDSRVHLRMDHDIVPGVNLFGSGEYDNFSGAANSDSPLLLAKSNASFMLGLSVSLLHSSQLSTKSAQ